MSFSLTASAVSFMALLALVQADTACISTKTVAPTTTLPTTVLTSYAIFYERSTTTMFESTVRTWSTTTIPLHTTSTIYSAAPTTIRTTTTTILRATNLKFKTCPTTPGFVKRCPKITTVVTTVPLKTVYSSTSTYTHTYIMGRQLETSYVPSTVIRSTVTTGSPPTTRVTSITLRPVTSIAFVQTTYSTIYDKTATSYYTPRITLTSTKTIPAPTATATPDLFSLQITNSSLFIDGYALTLPGEDGTAYVQNKSPAKFYIDPPTGWLIETTTKKHLSWYYSCRYEDPPCDNRLRFAPDVQESGSLGSNTHPLNCTVTCGQTLKCQGISFNVHLSSSGPLDNGTLYTSTDPTTGEGGPETAHLLVVGLP